MSVQKLLDPSSYGAEEYVVISLILFIIFVAVKHVIFHTLYYWWYGMGRLYVPEKIWDTLTGKTLPQRILDFVKGSIQGNPSVEILLKDIDYYCQEKEFALAFGNKKGEILDEIIKERQPEKLLICSTLCGYEALRVFRLCSPAAHIYVIEPDSDRAVVVKQFFQLADCESRVTVIASECSVAVPKLEEDYGIGKLDFVFMGRANITQSSHVEILKLLEHHKLLYSVDKLGEGPCTVILADKVVHLGDPEFLKYVRYSDSYVTKYYQMSLEYSPSDIVDGMEKAIHIGKL